jgi:hypothetical protein
MGLVSVVARMNGSSFGHSRRRQCKQWIRGSNLHWMEQLGQRPWGRKELGILQEQARGQCVWAEPWDGAGWGRN